MTSTPPTHRQAASSHVRMAVLGGGHLGRIHAKLLAARQDVTLVAVCDPIDASRRAIEDSLQVPTVAHHDELDGRIDAAVIAAPTTHHHALGCWCLARGIHLFIEKPIAASSQEADELVALAKRQGLTLQVGHVERFNPVWEASIEGIAPGTIQHVEARREGIYTGRSTDIGIVLDLMIHDLDLILSLIRSPLRSVRASGRYVLGEHEDFAIADLVFQNGATAHLRASRLAPKPARTMEIHAEDQWVSIDFAAGTAVRTRARDEVVRGHLLADRLPYEDRLKVKDELFSRWLQETELRPESGNAIACEHQDFLEAVRQGRAPRVTGHDGARALEVARTIADQIADRHAPISTILPAFPVEVPQRRAG